MATIALNGTSINFGMGICAFDSLGTAFSSAKKTTGGLQKAIGNLITKIDLAKTAAKVETAQTEAKNAKTREETKESSLTLAYDKLDTLINDVGTVDNKVSTKVSAEKNDFYKKYEYLKPECEKSLKEKIKDGFKSFCDKVVEIVGGFVEWCKEHWKELLIGLVCIVIGALITVFTAGTGTAFWAAFVAAIGKGIATAALSSVISGAINAAITYRKCKKAGMSTEMAKKYAKKAFGDGAATGFMLGGIGFGIGSGINAGAVAIVGKTNLLVAHSFMGAVGRTALFGATTSSLTCAATSAIGYWIENGTLKGSGKIILISAGIGALTGAVLGGYAGGKQYQATKALDSSFSSENIARTKNGQQTANRSGGKVNQGDNYSEYANYRQQTSHPNQKLSNEINIKNESIYSSNSSGKSTRLDQTLSNSDGKIVKAFEIKSSESASYNVGQNHYFAENGGKLVANSTVSGDKSVGQVGVQTLPEGFKIETVRPSNFTESIGVRLDGVFKPITSVKPFENGAGINSKNFLDVLSSVKNTNDYVNVTKTFFNDITTGEIVTNSVVNSGSK